VKIFLKITVFTVFFDASLVSIRELFQKHTDPTFCLEIKILKNIKKIRIAIILYNHFFSSREKHLNSI